MLGTLVLETDWILWLAAAFAFLYGLGVLLSVVVLLVKSAREARHKDQGVQDFPAKDKQQKSANKVVGTQLNQK